MIDIPEDRLKEILAKLIYSWRPFKTWNANDVYAAMPWDHVPDGDYPKQELQRRQDWAFERADEIINTLKMEGLQ